MDYEKKYKEALERAKQFSEKPYLEDSAGIVEYIFPELKESEDERIRKAIHIYLDWLDGRNKDYQPKGDYSIKDMIAWLEEQGERKPADKVEPKFHEGDWVILTAGELSATIQIVNIDTNKKLYWFNDNSYLPIVDEGCLHLWTIQDAKDGDVLALKNDTTHTLICMSPTTCDTGSYCRLRNGYFIKNKEYGWASALLTPATKEQRDLLLQKMKEAGYEWDAEKKELKKIEQKSQRMISAEAKEAMYDKPTWSEDDEKIITGIINDIQKRLEDYPLEQLAEIYFKEIDWLKSLRQRIEGE